MKPFLTCSSPPHPLHRSAIRSSHRQSHCRPIWAIYAVLKPSNPNLEKVYSNHIKKMVEDLGLTIRRADEIFSPEPFMNKVWDCICAAQLIIGDCTQQNPNVFYEIGIAHTAGKRIVFITRSVEDIPSDIRHFNFMHYIYDP